MDWIARFLFQPMYSVSLKKVRPLVTCLPLKKVRERGKGSYLLVCPREWSLIILIIAWNTKTCCLMLNCKRKSVDIKRKTLIPFKQIDVFYPTASIQGAYVICWGRQGGGIPGQTGAGGGEQEMGTKPDRGVRSAGYTPRKSNIPIHQFIYQI